MKVLRFILYHFPDLGRDGRCEGDVAREEHGEVRILELRGKGLDRQLMLTDCL